MPPLLITLGCGGMLLLSVPIGILAAIAIPNFVKFPCRSKQSEAKTNLKVLLVAEESHRAEFDKYVSLEKVQFRPRGKKIRYQYELVGFDETSFKARATGTGDMSGDVWFIDQENNLQHTDDGC